jgi:hypothetical protein
MSAFLAAWGKTAEQQPQSHQLSAISDQFPVEHEPIPHNAFGKRRWHWHLLAENNREPPPAPSETVIYRRAPLPFDWRAAQI